jgi:DNA polymerase-3 subunit gamma/tau
MPESEADALYTKYRPKKLSDVIGQDVVVRVLTNSFKRKNIHHAYLMSGTVGCGKTSSARVLAAMLNCEKGETLEPCGECKNCKDIFAGKSLDVKEIDAASNRGIDDVRELKSDSQYAPVNCRKKILLLDEAHSLSGHAAEALLKLVEEPPPNVIIILCTTEPEKLKPTIHSRCITLHFRPVSWPELYDHLKNIAKKENIKADDDALKFLAKASKMSVRNALQNLQSAVSYAGDENITLDMAQKAIGNIDESLYYQLVDSIGNDKIPDAWKIVNNLMSRGVNADTIVVGLETYLRNLMLIPLCKDIAPEMGFSEQEIKLYEFQSKQIKPILASEMLGLLRDVQRSIIVNLSPENALCRFVIESIVKKKQLAKKAQQK